jgi:RNA polymerase sigma-70 factor (ECF subfamily)
VSRTSLFTAALQPDARATVGALPDLEERLEVLSRTAREAWPGVELADDVFLPYLAGRLGAARRPEALAEAAATDLYLACACARGDARALAAFERAVMTVMDLAMEKLGAPADVRAEIEQEIREHLFVVAPGEAPGIERYRGRGPLRAWVRVIVVRKTMRALKGRRRHAGGDALLDHLTANVVSPLTDSVRRAHRGEVLRWLTQALAALDERGRTVLRQQLIDQMKVDDIAATHEVHPVTAARWLARARADLLEHMHRLAKEEGHMPRSEADELLRALGGQMDLSLERRLK